MCERGWGSSPSPRGNTYVVDSVVLSRGDVSVDEGPDRMFPERRTLENDEGRVGDSYRPYDRTGSKIWAPSLRVSAIRRTDTVCR